MRNHKEVAFPITPHPLYFTPRKTMLRIISWNVTNKIHMIYLSVL